MRPHACLALAIVLALAAAPSVRAQPAEAQFPHVAIVTNPDWDQKPTAADMSRIWPAEATKQKVSSGRVVLSCVVNADGRLDGCAVRQEEPLGAGFGPAAIKLSSLFRMKPKTVDGQPVGGATVTIPINFRTPAPPAPARYDTPPDWLKKPTYDEMMAVYPRAAGVKGANGKAVIKCMVNTEGLLRACSVLSETPAGLGFGQAAIVLAPTFLMKPALKDGRPVEAEVTVPINFESRGALAGPGVRNITIMGATVWAKAPSMPEILAEIDKKVGDKFADGKVALQCDLNRRTGKLSDCTVANISPGMAQFQGVARALVPKFQANPDALKDIKDDIRINLSFAFPDMQSPAWSQRYLTHPQWIRTVSPDPNQPLFPAEAAKAGLKTGSATVDCVIAADGSLTACKTVSESSPGVGFGPLAEQIAQTFAANPWTDDGLPADGAHVRMPIRMNYEPPAEAPAPTPSTKP